MSYYQSILKRSNTNFLPLIKNRENINKIDETNSIKSENENKIILNNDNIFSKNNLNDKIYIKKPKTNYYSNKNILNKININISNLPEKTLISNKALQNIKDILFNNKKKENINKIPFYNNLNNNNNSNNQDISTLIKIPSTSNFLSFNEKSNQNNSNIDYSYNNSLNNMKTSTYYNNTFNKSINCNTIEKINDFNKSDSFNKNSSYLFTCLLDKYSKSKKKKVKRKTFYKNTIYKLSPFFKYSKKENISAREIYKHYLKENHNDKPSKKKMKIKTKFNGSYDYSHVICPGLKKIYGNSPSFMNRMHEIKKNNVIAFKNDFNIKEYQTTLLRLMNKKISEKYLNKLRENYKIFNERNYGMIIPKGRYIDLAHKLKGHLSGDVYEHLKRMDKNYKIYFQKQQNDKKDKKDIS